MNISLYWNQKEFVFYLFLFIAYKYILSFCLAIKPCQCLEIDAIFDATIKSYKDYVNNFMLWWKRSKGQANKILQFKVIEYCCAVYQNTDQVPFIHNIGVAFYGKIWLVKRKREVSILQKPTLNILIKVTFTKIKACI